MRRAMSTPVGLINWLSRAKPQLDDAWTLRVIVLVPPLSPAKLLAT